MTTRYLHTYRCGFCKVTTASTVKAPYTAPITCVQCLRYMTYLWSSEITEARWQDISRRPLEFRSPLEATPVPPESRYMRCARRGCLVWKRKPELLNGRFCSEACGAADSEELAAFHDRVEAMYQAKPWLRPQAEETA